MPNSVNEYFAEKVYHSLKQSQWFCWQNILRAWLCARVPGILVKQTEALRGLVTRVTVICIPLGPGPGQTPHPVGFYYRGFVFWAVVGYKLRLILWQFLIRIFGEKSSTWKIYVVLLNFSLLLYIKHKRWGAPSLYQMSKLKIEHFRRTMEHGNWAANFTFIRVRVVCVISVSVKPEEISHKAGEVTPSPLAPVLATWLTWPLCHWPTRALTLTRWDGTGDTCRAQTVHG